MTRWACTFNEDWENKEFIYCYTSTDAKGFRVYVKLDGKLAEVVVSTSTDILSPEGRRELLEYLHDYLEKHPDLVKENCRLVDGKYIIELEPRVNRFIVRSSDWQEFTSRVATIYMRGLK